MSTIGSGSVAAASTLAAARLISPLRSRPVGASGGAGQALVLIGSSGRASKIACKALDGFVYRPRRRTSWGRKSSHSNPARTGGAAGQEQPTVRPTAPKGAGPTPFACLLIPRRIQQAGARR